MSSCKKPGRGHPLYHTWVGMRQRCNNPRKHGYRWYGARGIRVCKRWDDFALFLEDMGPRPSPKHSIDRIDVDGDYTPDNCRWTDAKTQANNKRSNVSLTVNGITKTMTEWSEETGVSIQTMASRVKLGWNDERVVTQSPKSKSPEMGLIAYKGKMQTMTEWAKETGIPYTTIQSRARRGWSAERILNG